ncbi:MAG: hypothetical protein IPI67_37980 [Myxococcales bacterium]|nr:hypothetical protein [Myxococcales bacterium]
MHAATTASAGDAAGREALCKYMLFPPIAQERVQLLGNDVVRLVLKRPFSDGTFALDLDQLALLVRLATRRALTRVARAELRLDTGAEPPNAPGSPRCCLAR